MASIKKTPKSMALAVLGHCRERLPCQKLLLQSIVFILEVCIGPKNLVHRQKFDVPDSCCPMSWWFDTAKLADVFDDGIRQSALRLMPLAIKACSL